MKQGDVKKIQGVRALLAKCGSKGCPPSVVDDVSSRLERLTSGVKVVKRAPNAFGKFLKSAYPRLKMDNPQMDPPAIMRVAAAEWRNSK